jgi:hypothetical protein
MDRHYMPRFAAYRLLAACSERVEVVATMAAEDLADHVDGDKNAAVRYVREQAGRYNDVTVRAALREARSACLRHPVG